MAFLFYTGQPLIKTNFLVYSIVPWFKAPLSVGALDHEYKKCLNHLNQELSRLEQQMMTEIQDINSCLAPILDLNPNGAHFHIEWLLSLHPDDHYWREDSDNILMVVEMLSKSQAGKRQPASPANSLQASDEAALTELDDKVARGAALIEAHQLATRPYSLLLRGLVGSLANDGNNGESQSIWLTNILRVGHVHYTLDVKMTTSTAMNTAYCGRLPLSPTSPINPPSTRKRTRRATA